MFELKKLDKIFFTILNHELHSYHAWIFPI